MHEALLKSLNVDAWLSWVILCYGEGSCFHFLKVAKSVINKDPRLQSLSLMLIFLVAVFLCRFAIRYYQIKCYQKTEYYKFTRAAYLSVLRDKGRYGEYLAYMSLRFFDAWGCKFLFNLNLPKDGVETTELDVVMLSAKGIFVIESKNFQGWIFGNEAERYWMQVLPRARVKYKKSRFYNPIMQNDGHIKFLKRIVGGTLPLHSIIVFSDLCLLKDVTVKRQDVKLVHLGQLFYTVLDLYQSSEVKILAESEINDIYQKLSSYACQTNKD